MLYGRVLKLGAWLRLVLCKYPNSLEGSSFSRLGFSFYSTFCWWEDTALEDRLKFFECKRFSANTLEVFWNKDKGVFELLLLYYSLEFKDSVGSLNFKWFSGFFISLWESKVASFSWLRLWVLVLGIIPNRLFCFPAPPECLLVVRVLLD